MKRHLAMFTILSVLAISAVVVHSSAQTSKRVIVRAGKLLDVKSGKTLTNTTIVIEGEKIVSVGADAKATPSDIVVDLSGATVLPGLIDVHTHLTMNPQFGYDALAISIPREALIGAKN